MDNSRRFTAFHLSHEKTPRTKLRELGHRITGHCVVFGRPRPRLYGTAVAPLGWIGWEVVCFKLKGFCLWDHGFSTRFLSNFGFVPLGSWPLLDLQAGSSRDACRVCPILFTMCSFVAVCSLVGHQKKRLGLFRRGKTVQPERCRRSLVSLTSMVRGCGVTWKMVIPGSNPRNVH